MTTAHTIGVAFLATVVGFWPALAAFLNHRDRKAARDA